MVSIEEIIDNLKQISNVMKEQGISKVRVADYEIEMTPAALRKENLPEPKKANDEMQEDIRRITEKRLYGNR